MRIVYDSFEGRYSDNPRALYEWLQPRVPGEHIWMSDARHLGSFPPDTITVPHGSAEAVAALESADLVVANTHLDFEWDKRPETTYLQTWHGTPLKRIHHDVVSAPPGRLTELGPGRRPLGHLLSPNAASTAAAAQGVPLPGPILENGYPRNDVLLPPGADAVRARVRAALGVADGDDRGALRPDLARRPASTTTATTDRARARTSPRSRPRSAPTTCCCRGCTT